MARSDGAHGVLGGIPFKLDQSAPDEVQRPAYRHFFRPLFRQGIDITGKPGAQNLREDRLLWHNTDWGGGEGQVVLQNNDDRSARRFYRSEGLNFKVPGQIELNPSIQINSPADASGGASATSEGSAWSDVSGTSTVVNTTDRRLNALTNVIESATHTPGAGQVQAVFHLYKEAAQLTTIQGADLVKMSGSAAVQGTDIALREPGTTVRTGPIVSGTDVSADSPVSVGFVVYHDEPFAKAEFKVRILDSSFSVIASETRQVITLASTTLGLTFTPTGTNTYYFSVSAGNRDYFRYVDDIRYSQADANTSVTLTVRNTTAGTNIASKTINISSTSSAAVATLNYNSAAATNYRYRVTYNSGAQRPIADKSVASVLTTASGAWTHAAMELGLDGKIWLVSNRAAVDSIAYTYDFTNEDWDVANAALADTALNDECRALAHSDSWEYSAHASGVIIQFDEAGDADYIAALTDLTGMAICQNRLFALTEDDAGTNGVQIRTYAVDADVSVAVTAVLQTVTVSSAKVAADTTLRERMVGTPSGARFFVNYSDVSCVIYEADASGSTTVVRELCRLDEGAKATAIAHVAGLTFVTAQFMAETGETARCALFVIDQSNTPRRVGYFRRDDPTAAAVVSMQPYQNDLWLLQGKFIWRYSLQTGGLFLEYQLEPGDQSYARQIAVLQGHVFAAFAQEDSTNTGGAIWVAGSVGTYRQASVAEGNSVTSSVFDYGLPGINKTLRSIQVITDELPSNTSVVIEAQYDQDNTWVPVGTHSSGAEANFIVSTGAGATEFRTIQLRTTLNSATGTATPVVKAVIVEALCLDFEEFFELAILTEHEDSSFHVSDKTRNGGELVQGINGLRRSRTPVTFIDAFEHPDLDNNPEYLVVFDTSDGSNDEVAEGRMMVRLRVL